MSYEIFRHSDFDRAIKRLVMAIVNESHGRMALLTIYDIQDTDTVNLRVIREMARELGFSGR